MNILITGATGFIGKHLVNYFQKDHHVWTISRSSQASDKYFSLDLTDPDAVKSKLDPPRDTVDVILHLASRLMTAQEATDIDVFYDNVKMAESVVYLAQSLEAKKVINFSTIAVYPNTDGNYTETAEIRPSANAEGLYGLSKFCSENLLELLLKNSLCKVTNLRLSQIYGEGMREDRIFTIMKKELLQNNTITVFGDGERISNFMEIGQLLKVVDHVLDKDLSGIYNIGQENISYLQLAENIIRQFGNENSKIIKVDKGSRAKVRIDTSKLEKTYPGGTA